MSKKLILFLATMFFVFAGADSTVARSEADEEGSEDHPMISRFEGSHIVAYEKYDYDRLNMATEMEDGEAQETVFEGEVTRIVYKGPDERSSFEIYRNFEIALKDSGFEILYNCLEDHKKCMELAPFQIDGLKYGEKAGMGKDARYLFAKLPDSSGDIYVSVHTAIAGGQTPYTLLQVVENKNMETGNVEVDIDAAAMADDIDEKGSVRIYGVHFDSDKSTIKKKSESTLAEIAELLEEESGLRLGVVGHTDAIGSVEYNMGLSRERAEAVVDFLTSEHGIAESRLTPEGVGPFAPVASNEDEDSRSRNRRVELVKMVEE